MKKHLQGLASLLLVAFMSFKGSAQSFSATYDFTGVSTTSGTTDPTPPPTAAGATFGSFTAVGALSTNPNAGGRFSFTGWPTGATNGLDAFTGSIDLTKYYSVTITPQAFYTLNLDNITFTLQRSGTGIRQYAVRSSADGYASNLSASISPANANLQVVGTTNVFQVSDASTVAENGSTITLGGGSFTNISGPVTFRFYGFNAEASGGTFSIDNVKFAGSTVISPTAPNITITPASLDFSPVAVNGTSAPLTYTVQGNNLIAPVIVTATAPFSVSETANGIYTTSLTLPAASVTSAKTIYVKFAPTVLGAISGTITHTSTSATTKTITATGQGIDPANLSFNFNTCANTGIPGLGFTPYSVTGPQVWNCTTFGRNNTNGVNINGYSGGPVENEDWLISPPLGIASLTLPVLRFWSRAEFSGPPLKLLVSTNYAGTGDPNLATWTDLNANFPPATNVWTLTDGINLSAYKSAPKVYIAFKYISTVEEGAARWTLDDVDVTDRNTLLTVFPASLDFGEASVNTTSPGSRFTFQTFGYGNVTVTAPANFQVSTDSLTGYTSAVAISQAVAEAGTYLFARFAPATTALRLQGQIKITATGLDSNTVSLSGTSFPKSQTFDAGCYNLSFFGSNPTNNPTPEKIATQVANIATVLKRINLDVVGVEEVSNDVAFDSLVKRLPHHKGVLSSRWSYSFDPPDPNFPPQKTGFIYDSTTVQLIGVRDMFVTRYDSARNPLYTNDPTVLPNYPGGTPQSFWASGRLPFMATFNVTINGVSKRLRIIDIHAKSASDAASYNRRVYDVKVLKDSLDAYYSTDSVILVGDYNDRVFGSIYGATGATSPYKPFVDDAANYSVLTYPLDQAGRVSFIGGTGLIDHITISNELVPFSIPNSTDIEDPRTYISNYNATTASDHLPVYTRMIFPAASPLPVTLVSFTAKAQTNSVLVTWTTATELNNRQFVVERSANGTSFTAIGTVASAGNGNTTRQYQFTDNSPLPNRSFYRLRQVDIDGKATTSGIATVMFGKPKIDFTIYPNPVTDRLQISSTASDATIYSARVIAVDGKVVLQMQGTISVLNQQLNRQSGALVKGLYILKLSGADEQYMQKFIKQ